jgi:hypothetical protein
MTHFQCEFCRAPYGLPHTDGCPNWPKTSDLATAALEPCTSYPAVVPLGKLEPGGVYVLSIASGVHMTDVERRELCQVLDSWANQHSVKFILLGQDLRLLQPIDVTQALAPLVRDEVAFWMKEYGELQRLQRIPKP